MPKHITAGLTETEDATLVMLTSKATPHVIKGGAIGRDFFEKGIAPMIPQSIYEVVPLTIRNGNSGVLATKRNDDDPYWGKTIINNIERQALWHTIGTAVRRSDFEGTNHSSEKAFPRLKRDEMSWDFEPVLLPYVTEALGVRGATVSRILWTLITTDSELPEGVRFFSREDLEAQLTTPEEYQEFIVEQIPFIFNALDDFDLTQQILHIMRLREYAMDTERETQSDVITYMVIHSDYDIVAIAHAVKTAWRMYRDQVNNHS